MVLFDLANRFPAMGVQLKKLMIDEGSVTTVIVWIDEYLAGLRDEGVISCRELLECQTALAMCIGVGKTHFRTLVTPIVH
tara:strand:- start:187 stop:426 length:240 start_codon:yes stop_codon:yes gene_type:complete